MNRYTDWVYENIKEPKNRCVEATLEMQKVFPELIRVRGHYKDVLWGDRPHWWLKTPEGKIIDPTANQFFFGEIMPRRSQDYEEMNEENPITGKCPNCGGYSRNHKTCCSDKCSEEFGDYIKGIV